MDLGKLINFLVVAAIAFAGYKYFSTGDITFVPPNQETVRKLKANQIEGSAVQKQLDGTSITAVLTAHPTEVQRQTVLGFNRRIHSLLSMRERCTNAEALTDLRREIDTVLLSLWQTSETRHHKLSVHDEINNGVSIFPMSFFEALPKLYRGMEREFQTAYPDVVIPDILKIGGWIGGDRDGNPFVSADTLRTAFAQQASAVFRFYRSQLYKLYEELPMSIRRVKVSPEVLALSAKSPDTERAHEEEPYRRALAYILARTVATAHRFGSGLGSQFGLLEPYDTVEEFLADLHIVHTSLCANGGRPPFPAASLPVAISFLSPTSCRQATPRPPRTPPWQTGRPSRQHA